MTDSLPTCEFPASNPAGPEVVDVLKKSRRIAVVGLSPRPERESNMVAAYLLEHGYDVIPVNPAESEILGRPCYPDLRSVPVKIDIVDIFRKTDAIPEIIAQALEIGPQCVWLQLGLAYNAAIESLAEAGIVYVQSKCLKIEHSRLLAEGKL